MGNGHTIPRCERLEFPESFGTNYCLYTYLKRHCFHVFLAEGGRRDVGYMNLPEASSHFLSTNRAKLWLDPSF